MKKTTRINTEMRYINNHQHFTISELMAVFGISRSTATRDLADIQELGMPLTSQVGPAGGYTVLRNQLLPAVQFNTDELQALFVSFIATANTQLPFLNNRQTLTQKLLAIASPTQRTALQALTQLLRFETTNPTNTNLLELTDIADPLLTKLINASFINRHLVFTLTDGDQLDGYLQYLYHHATEWLVVVFDLEKRQTRVINLTQFSTVEPDALQLSPVQLQQQIATARQLPNIDLQLGPHAIQQFKRLHRPNRVLHYLDPFEQSASYQDYVSVDQVEELNDMVDWLLFLGQDVTVVQAPQQLRIQAKKRLQQWN